jgi:NAD+ kinase
VTRVFVVGKRTAHRLYGHHPNVKKLVARRDIAVARMKRAHQDHEATLAEVRDAVKTLGLEATYYDGSRSKLRGKCDLVVTVGGDGTLLGASHQIGPDTPVLGINSAPADSVGFFCGAQKGRVLEALRGALAGTLPRVELARMRVECNEQLVHDRVLNEALFCHETPAAASRYILRHGRREEEQLSSGFWVGTAAGSTGALHSAGGDVLPLESKELELVVREPFAGSGKRYRMTKVLVKPSRELVVTSKMRDAVLFLDGPFQRTVVRLGDQVAFAASEEPVRVLGLTASRGR